MQTTRRARFYTQAWAFVSRLSLLRTQVQASRAVDQAELVTVDGEDDSAVENTDERRFYVTARSGARHLGRRQPRHHDALGPDGIEITVLLEVPEEELVARLLQRAAEQGRADDNEVTIRRRLAVYHEQTAPLIDFYRTLGCLSRVDGVGAIDEVLARVVAGLVP